MEQRTPQADSVGNKKILLSKWINGRLGGWTLRKVFKFFVEGMGAPSARGGGAA